MGLFFAKHTENGVTEYTSRRTGRTFKVIPEANGEYTVEGGGFITATNNRAGAIRFIELADAA